MTALRKQVGQLLIAGLQAEQLSALESSWLKMIEPAGVILFRRNIESPAQTHELLTETDSLGSTPMFRCVDIEGGLVDRLRNAVTLMPSLAAVAASGRKSLYRKHGSLIGHEASALGFNTVFAPVLDLALSQSTSVMRTRTYFSNPKDLVAYADAFISGLESTGIQSCGKHFPGLGGGDLDSHHATPIISRSWQTLWADDLIPYRKLRSRLAMVMVSHAIYPQAGDSKPASISKYWITDILTKRIGYRGLILSDDMEMGGILNHTLIEEACIEAIAAGTHLIEICKDTSLLVRSYEALLAEAERSKAFERIVRTAYRKIVKSKRALIKPSPGKPPSPLQIQKLRDEIMEFSAGLPEPKEVIQ
jgi:beta-N-acetylhexosaminidase